MDCHQAPFSAQCPHRNQCSWCRCPSEKAYVTLNTTKGPLNLELECNLVPRTCENFIVLCEMGYYTGTLFHRSIRNFMVQVCMLCTTLCCMFIALCHVAAYCTGRGSNRDRDGWALYLWGYFCRCADPMSLLVQFQAEYENRKQR